MSRTRFMVLSFVVLLLCCGLSGYIPVSPSTGTGTTTVRVVSYNVENAFDNHVDGTEYSDYGPSSNY
ncbi:hypothetical protein [Candidatus Cryosericum septentrionale]|jgi:hypothetical protein|uniref:Uncharacterized protein n=1 Tax=Candidatus Cryosericum septentrionale TaxID=2290913 RepID=A0A398DPA8_9BACT|nr:hypothetical protein [Candidatus Cryosericum septentrionale]RIE17045.1 hypothetical protein SMC1_03575 [Candidatus Cryosericum septentrionale]